MSEIDWSAINEIGFTRRGWDDPNVGWSAAFSCLALPAPVAVAGELDDEPGLDRVIATLIAARELCGWQAMAEHDWDDRQAVADLLDAMVQVSFLALTAGSACARRIAQIARDDA